MKVSEMFPSRYLTGSDLRGPVQVTIAGVEKQEVYRQGEGQTEIYVLFCERASKGVVLNKTLARQISQALGSDDTADWAGKQIILFSQNLKVGGEPVTAIRARAAQPQGEPSGQ